MCIYSFVRQLKNCRLVFSFALYQDDRQITMLLAPGHNPAAFLIPVPWTAHNTYVMGNRWKKDRDWNFKLIVIICVAVKSCGKFIMTGKSVLYVNFKSSREVKRKWPSGGRLWILFESIWLKIKVIVCIIIVAWNCYSPTGNQLWNSGCQCKIFSCIGNQESAISDPVIPVWCCSLQAFQKRKYQVSVSEDQRTGFLHHAAQQNAWYASWVHLYLFLLSEISLLVLPHLKVDLNHFQFLQSSSWLQCWAANKTVTHC